MTSTELAWAAGIVDGEGCISIIRYGPEHAARCKTVRHILHLKVTMGHLGTIQRLRGLTGLGTVQNHAARSIKVNASFSWIAQSRSAESALRLLRPYLVTKAAEADVGLAFMALPIAKRGGRNGGCAVPPALLRKRDALYWKLRKLKARWRFYSGGGYKGRGGR
jgi:hypothetical protein